MNVYVQRYGDYVHAISRFVRSVGVEKKSTSRVQLFDCSFNVLQKPAEGDLVAYFRFKDVHNKNRIYTDPNGRQFEKHQLESVSEEPSTDFFAKNVVPAGSAAYIQDEDIDRTKADISRVIALFGTPRGVTTMEEGSLVFPLTVGGKSSAGAASEETVKQYDMNRGYQHIALSVQHSTKGEFMLNEKV